MYVITYNMTNNITFDISVYFKFIVLKNGSDMPYLSLSAPF